MTKSEVLEQLQTFDDQLEYQEAQGERKEGWYSFKMEVIGKTPEYQIMSEAMMGNDLNHSDWNYTFMSDTIDTLKEIVEYHIEDDEENAVGAFGNAVDDFFFENLREYIYTSEYNSLIADASWLLDEVVSEWGIEENILASAFRFGQERYCLSFAQAILDTFEE